MNEDELTRCMTRLAAAVGDEVQLLNFTDEQIARANGGLDLWTPYVIPAGTYGLWYLAATIQSWRSLGWARNKLSPTGTS